MDALPPHPPSGYDSWLEYAVATMDTRRLASEHALGHHPQWPASVTREQLQAAAMAELRALPAPRK